jgi:DNA repair protein RadC
MDEPEYEGVVPLGDPDEMRSELAPFMVPQFKLQLKKCGEAPVGKITVETPADIFQLAAPYMLDSPFEKSMVLLLDEKRRLIGISEPNVGSLNKADSDIGLLVSLVMMSGACVLVDIHSHPRGSGPSVGDRIAKDKLKAALELMGRSLGDFVVFTDNGVFSFLDANEL